MTTWGAPPRTSPTITYRTRRAEWPAGGLESARHNPIAWLRSDYASPRPRAAAPAAEACVALERLSSLTP